MLHLNLKFSRLITFTALFLFSSQVLLQASNDPLPIEGISYESKNPSQSIVVINGNVYKKGEKYDAFEIMEVQQDRVVLKNASGQVSEHRIIGGNHAATALPTSEKPRAPKSVSHTNQETTSPQAKSPETSSDPLEKLKKMFAGLDPTIILNQVSQMAVMADMRNLYTTAAAAAMEEGADRQLSVDQLIKDGRLNPAYKEAKNGYQFRIEVKGEGVQVYANPIKAGEKSRHFMIDVWGNIRSEDGRPATDNSPLMKPLGAGEIAQQASQQQGG